jgi:type II secretory pathway component PulC
LLVVFLIGCAPKHHSNRGLPTKRITELRTVEPEFKVVKREVSRRQYVQALEDQTTLKSIRLVPVLKSAAGQTSLPEYRIFDIQDDSAYTILGLENADILVAAEGYVVVEPEIFPQYAKLLKDQKKAIIELRRSNQPVLLQVSFID